MLMKQIQGVSVIKEGKIIYSGNPEKPALDEIRDKQNPSLNKS